jgi:hypothetical protein
LIPLEKGSKQQSSMINESTVINKTTNMFSKTLANCSVILNRIDITKHVNRTNESINEETEEATNVENKNSTRNSLSSTDDG